MSGIRRLNIWRGTVAVVLAFSMAREGSGVYPACKASGGVTCIQLKVERPAQLPLGRVQLQRRRRLLFGPPAPSPPLVFDCTVATAAGAGAVGGDGVGLGLVYFAHGNDGAYAKAMWLPTMLKLAAKGHTCLACDGRGFSPGASPSDYEAYHYDHLAADIFGIVDAYTDGYVDPNTTVGRVNGKGDGGSRSALKFHMVSHDQGARVAWHAIHLGQGRERFITLASLSIPHSDVFSDAIFPSSSGPGINPAQQLATQYVRMLVLPNSTTLQNGALFRTFCTPGGWMTTVACQKILWWYVTTLRNPPLGIMLFA